MDGKVDFFLLSQRHSRARRGTLGTRRRRALSPRAASLVAHPGNATAGRPSAREDVLAHQGRLPISPPTRSFARRDTFSSWHVRALAPAQPVRGDRPSAVPRRRQGYEHFLRDLLRTLFGLAPPNSHSTMVSNSSFSTLPFVGGEEDAQDFIRDKYEAHRRAASLDEPRAPHNTSVPASAPPPSTLGTIPSFASSAGAFVARPSAGPWQPGGSTLEQLPTDGEAEDTTGSGVEPEMIRGSGGHDGFGGVARNREGNDGIERATRHTRTFATRHSLPPTRSSFLRARASNPTLLLVLVIVRLEREGNRLSFPVHFRLRRGRRGRRESVGTSNLRRHLLCRPRRDAFEHVEPALHPAPPSDPRECVPCPNASSPARAPRYPSPPSPCERTRRPPRKVAAQPGRWRGEAPWAKWTTCSIRKLRRRGWDVGRGGDRNENRGWTVVVAATGRRPDLDASSRRRRRRRGPPPTALGDPIPSGRSPSRRPLVPAVGTGAQERIHHRGDSLLRLLFLLLGLELGREGHLARVKGRVGDGGGGTLPHGDVAGAAWVEDSTGGIVRDRRRRRPRPWDSRARARRAGRVFRLPVRGACSPTYDVLPSSTRSATQSPARRRKV